MNRYEVTTETLEPNFRRGDTLYVDSELEPQAGDWVLIGRTVERYGAGPVDGVVVQAGRRYR
jgi:hypothetical protein